MAKRKFRVGDKVKVVGMSPVTFAPGAKDELGTEKLFKSIKVCSEKSIRSGDLTNTGTSNFNRSDSTWFGSSRNL